MFLTRPTFSTGFATNATDSAYPDLWKGLIGLWSPELGKQALFLYDWSGHGHKGTLNGIDPSTAYVAGSHGYVLNYTGSSTFVDCGYIPEMDDASKNLTLLFRMRSSATASQTLITYDNNSVLQPSADWYCYINSSNELRIGGFGSTSELATGITGLRDGKWHRIAIVLKQTTIEVYVDGVLRYNPANTKTHTNFNSGFSLQFGAAENVASYVGDLGEVRLYNRDLLPSEIREDYLGASPLILSPLFNRGIQFIVTVDDSDTLIISDSLDISETTSNGSDTITLSDVLQVIETNFNGSDTITLSDVLDVNERTVTDSDSITITDSIMVDIVDENTSTDFGVRILSINPLLFVSNSNPPEITKVDTTIPSSPTWIIEPILGITSVYDAYINDTNDFIYVAADTGIIVKIEIADLSNQTIFNTGDSNNISTIDGLPLFGLTHAGTDQTTGELYILDERNTFQIDSDFQLVSNFLFPLDSDFQLIQAKKLDSDFEFLAYQQHFINTDFKFLSDIVSDITPIKQTKFRIYIDNIEVIDPDLSLNSIQIVHTIDNESTATFKLNRKHDDINRNLFGDTIIINNQNSVRIEIDGHVEFDGKISNLDCQYTTSGEQINVTALQPQPDYLLNDITLSLPSINERLGLYNILIQNPNIFNPFIDDRIVVVSSTGDYWTNSLTWSSYLTDVKVFATYQDAVDYIAATILTNPDFAVKNPQVGYANGNPKKYKGIAVSLGQKKTQDIKRFTQVSTGEATATAIQNGTFHPLQNWTYFWSCIVEKIKTAKPVTVDSLSDPYSNILDAPFLSLNAQGQPIIPALFQTTENKISTAIFNINQEIGSGLPNDPIYFRYIGTSLSPVSANLFILKNAYYSYQRKYSDIIEELDTYTVGSAPFKVINPRNGVLITKFHWEDRPDGQYSVKDAAYDYREYVKRVADLEYQKLLNINDDILPESKCNMTLTLDAYYYYGLKLLTRINIDNTTVADTYNLNNGFPTSIKSITISSSDMSISIQTDNLKSSIELKIIDSAFPDENSTEFVYPEVVLFNAQKTDMATRLAVE